MARNSYQPPGEADDPYRSALIAQMRNRSGNTGVSGIGKDGGVQAPPLVAPSATDTNTQPPAEPAAPPKTYGIGGGFNQDKMQRPAGESFKYDWANAAKKYDPTKGISPELLADINGMGYGTFSGSGQKLSLKGLTDKGRQAGLLGDYDNADMITGFANGNNPGAVWGYQDPFAEAQEAQNNPAAAGGGMGGGLPGQIGALDQLKALGNGSVLEKIQAALKQFMGGQVGAQ